MAIEYTPTYQLHHSLFAQQFSVGKRLVVIRSWPGDPNAVVSGTHSNVNILCKQAFRLFRFVEIVRYTALAQTGGWWLT